MKVRYFSVFSLFLLMCFSSSLFANPGKDIFDRFCTACHTPAMAPMFNSPAAHDIDAWTVRKDDAFSKAVEKDSSVSNVSAAEKDEISINELVKSAINGTDKGMPPKGTCTDCTDDELKSVIEFMSSSE